MSGNINIYEKLLEILTLAGRRPLVFICSPFAGDMELNVRNARKYCKYAVEQGATPLAPHLHYPQFMDDRIDEQRKLGLSFGLLLLEKCDEIWVCGDEVSEGMRLEILRAQSLGKKIRFLGNKKEAVI